MHLPTLLLATLLPALSLAASPQLDKFRALAKKGNGLVALNAAQYDEIVSQPRDYSVSVVLTALGAQYKCQPCQLLQPEYTLLAKQWHSTKRSDEDEHFFAYLDFQAGPEIFQRLGLQSAPTFQLWMPTEGPRSSSQLGADNTPFGFQAEAIASHLSTRAKLPSLQFKRPVDKSRLVKTGAGIAVAGIVGWQARRVLAVVFGGRFLWGALSVFTILFMTSGFMWAQIRRPLYVQPQRDGKINYIAGGYQTQLGAEVHLISAIYGLLAFSAYTLAYTIPKVRDPIRQRLGIWVWTGVLVVMAGVLMNIFGGMKQPGYPFRIF
ncbi:hypothetical protein JCM6882_008044 [Rhodosporidiobolus microsporus]